jgi:hypothetical protein
MQTTSEQYIVDAQGQRLSVVVEFDYYQKLLARLEELEEIYAFDLAEESQDEAIQFDQAIGENLRIGNSRKKAIAYAL